MSGPAELDAPYWRGLEEGRLLFQRCPACGYRRWPPAEVCPECLAEGGQWEEVGGTGTVWSVAVYEHAFVPELRDAVPYNVVLVELDAGPALIATVVGVAHEAIQPGMRVQAVFDAADGDKKLVRFAIM